MAPEQAAGHAKQLTTTADVYSLGAILYELLTGRPPFRGETALATMRQVAEQDPKRPRVLNPRLDRSLETICLKCLEKNPLKRTSAEALRGLGAIVRGEPVQARGAQPEPVLALPAQTGAGGIAAALVLAVIASSPASWRCDGRDPCCEEAVQRTRSGSRRAGIDKAELLSARSGGRARA
jgi:serine/threonine-protein kinase